MKVCPDCGYFSKDAVPEVEECDNSCHTAPPSGEGPYSKVIVGFTCERLCGKDRLFDEHAIEMKMLLPEIQTLIELGRGQSANSEKVKELEADIEHLTKECAGLYRDNDNLQKHLMGAELRLREATKALEGAEFWMVNNETNLIRVGLGYKNTLEIIQKGLEAIRPPSLKGTPETVCPKCGRTMILHFKAKGWGNDEPCLIIEPSQGAQG